MKKRFILTAMCLAHGVSLAGTMVIGHVKEIQLNKDMGNVAFIQLDSPQTSPIACQTNVGWTYTIPLVTDMDKKMFAVLSMALASGQTVRLYGSGACSDFGAVESARAVSIQQ